MSKNSLEIIKDALLVLLYEARPALSKIVYELKDPDPQWKERLKKIDDATNEVRSI